MRSENTPEITTRPTRSRRNCGSTNAQSAGSSSAASSSSIASGAPSVSAMKTSKPSRRPTVASRPNIHSGDGCRVRRCPQLSPSVNDLLDVGKLYPASVCYTNAASTSATRRCVSGGTGLARCSLQNSEDDAFIIDRILTGAGTWTRCSFASTARRITSGARSITKARCLKFLPRNGGIERLR